MCRVAITVVLNMGGGPGILLDEWNMLRDGDKNIRNITNIDSENDVLIKCES